MEQSVLLNTLERILGKGSPASGKNYKFHCPNCNHQKKKLEINLTTQQWACWVCGNKDNFKGKSIKSLFKRLKVQKKYFDELNYSSDEEEDIPNYTKEIKLPDEFIPLYNPPSLSVAENIIYAHAAKYLSKDRKLTRSDIIKHNIGFCEKGDYANRVIVPSYDENGMLNYFVSRSLIGESYINPGGKKDEIIGFELFINWNAPIIICEGVFDAITAKRNAIPLLGKGISSALMKKLVTSKVKKIYIALDPDALDDAIKYAEELFNSGKEVYLVELKDKDVNELGFKEFTKIISQVEPLDSKQLMLRKIA